MEAIWQFALRNPALLVVPACGFVLALLVMHVKKRYVNEGMWFRRSPRPCDDSTSKPAEQNEMMPDRPFDLTIALRTFEQLGLEDGGQRYAYWNEVGQLLKRATGMQAKISALRNALEHCLARLRKED
ncbi:hypothetical protein [Paraburkholderia metrosideri]|uniref:Transmembrane protein n=1 Tax=Paraburkholderia metrosideri TaxID=580937 RepID=A0ABN7I0A2_9BURK|nr:hypothetical protein [Paraburkholderia metrosideri]CAD6538867.1 hypothetical protein LMG28140_03307 [Paraburkholderia metrosideri]